MEPPHALALQTNVRFQQQLFALTAGHQRPVKHPRTQTNCEVPPENPGTSPFAEGWDCRGG